MSGAQRARPWSEAGFKFYTDEMKQWLNGYEPRAADEQRRPSQVQSAITRSTTPSLVRPNPKEMMR